MWIWRLSSPTARTSWRKARSGSTGPARSCSNEAICCGRGSWPELWRHSCEQPPENCTPQKNAQATLDGVNDLQAWATDYIQAEVKTISAGGQPQPPGVPGFRHACTERLPGFAQSRFPATQTIPVRATDDYLT